jgi:hypothetical protein
MTPSFGRHSEGPTVSERTPVGSVRSVGRKRPADRDSPNHEHKIAYSTPIHNKRTGVCLEDIVVVAPLVLCDAHCGHGGASPISRWIDGGYSRGGLFKALAIDGDGRGAMHDDQRASALCLLTACRLTDHFSPGHCDAIPCGLPRPRRPRRRSFVA